ncbi:MlaD family protein [Mycolicibacter sinensis]|nr:MlaD family protein [Mycolicibacter sinensis]
MMTASHLPLRILGGFAAVAVALSATSCVGRADAQQTAVTQQFCAHMSDSIGLYVGNWVTQMGYKIGTIDRITPGSTDVKIDFTITENRPLPSDVKAVTRSTSILADRSLELVGNYQSGPLLQPGNCIVRERTMTPLSISQVIGSATNFVNGISPAGSDNLKDALRGFDESAKDNGPKLNRLLTNASALLDSPDQAIADIGQIVRNVTELTSMLERNRSPAKEILLDTPVVAPELVKAVGGVDGLASVIHPMVGVVVDIETQLGDDIQLTLDIVSDSIRHLSPHYKGIVNLLNPVPRFINTFSYELNNKQFNTLRWRPPIYRVHTPDGLVTCGMMNQSMPGSCADVNGQPYAVDVALLQYVLLEASRR